MNRALSIMLSLSLVLCSCGKSNEPLVKRDVPEYEERTILVNLYDKDKKKLGALDIHVEGIKGQSVVNIDSLKKSVAVSDKNFSILSALYCKGDVCETLTEKDVNIDEIDRFSLVCEATSDETPLTPTPTTTPTPIPSLTPVPNVTATKAIPSASASPVPTVSSDPNKKTEEKKINNKYSYFKIACVVVAVILATIFIIRMVKKCKDKTITRAGSDGKESGREELIPIPQPKAKEDERDSHYDYDEEDQEEGTKEKEEEKEEEETRDEAEASRALQRVEKVEQLTLQAGHTYEEAIAVSQQQFQQGQKGTKEKAQRASEKSAEQSNKEEGQQPTQLEALEAQSERKKEVTDIEEALDATNVPSKEVPAKGCQSRPDPKPEPAQDTEDDVDRLQTEVSIGMRNMCMIDISVVANLIISINQQGELNQVPDNIQQGAYGLLIAYIRPYKLETFTVIVKAINVLGRLEDARSLIEQKCTKYNLVLNEILAEPLTIPT